jgi:hypothetical protein
MMKSATFLWAFLFVMAGCVGLATPSNASTLVYTLQNVTDGAGDSFTGQFHYDTATSAFSNVNITASGPNTTGETFTDAGIQPVNTSSTSLQDNSALTVFSVHFAGNLGTQALGSPDTIVNLAYQDSSHGLHVNNPNAGDVIATPLPAALPLFASGLGALGLLARNRKRKTALAA